MLVVLASGMTCLWLWAIWPLSQLGAMVGILALFTGHAFVLAFEFVAVGWVNRNESTLRANGWALIRAWWLEVHVAPAVFAWRQPFRWHEYPDSQPCLDARSSDRAAVFIHGFVCNRGLWLPWLEEMRRRGLHYTTVNLEPVFGSIDDYLPLIEDAVRRALELEAQPPVIVCHSMGGLAIRAWLAADPANADRIHRVVTIGSPHHGTWLARFSMSANGQQMRMNGDWLKALADQERENHPDPYRRFICWFSNADNIVFPTSTALLPGADNRHVPGVAHVALAFHHEVMNTSLAMLSSGPTSSSALTEA
jgi:triacylglycerol lipase